MSSGSALSRRRFCRLLGAWSLSYLQPARVPARDAGQAPLSPAALKLRAGRVIEILERHIETGYLVGAVALIGHGARAEVVTVGDQSLEAERPMQRDSLFRITSLTEPITAAAALMLVDEGKLRLTEPIDGWLPELAHRRVLRRLGGPLADTLPARRAITLEDLLTFRCGLGVAPNAPDDSPLQRRIADLKLLGFGAPDPAASISPDEWLQRLGTLPLMAQPGETWLYHTGSCILGVLIARAARKTLPQLLQERLFGPLGMRDTGFTVPSRNRDRFVSAYRVESGHLQLKDEAAGSPWMRAPMFPDAAAGLVSTVDDLFAFSHLLLSQGHPGAGRLLSARAVTAMTRDQLTATQREAATPLIGNRRGWGLGLTVVRETTPQGIPAGAYGATGGFGTSWVADPLSGASAILLTQTLFTSPAPPAVHQEFWSAVFAPPLL